MPPEMKVGAVLLLSESSHQFKGNINQLFDGALQAFGGGGIKQINLYPN
jgi:hypothetical protein